MVLIATSAYAQMPISLRPGQTPMAQVTQEIDQILKVSESDIMDGIRGYGLNVGAAIKEKVMDEVIKALAESSVLSPAAVAILETYQKKKDEKLAEAIDEVKKVAKKAISTQLKLGYQNYKVDYERQTANTRLGIPLRNSQTEAVAQNRMTGLYGNYVDVVEVFYNNADDHDLIRSYDPNAGYYLIGTAAFLADTKTLEAKLALANRQYNRSAQNGGEIASMSAYERMLLKREVQAEARSRQASLYQMQQMTRQMLYRKQKIQARQQYRTTIGMPRQAYTPNR